MRALDASNAWTVTDYLLANIADTLAGANWQRGGDAKAPRPTPLPRPSDPPPRVPESYEDLKARIAAHDKKHRRRRSKRIEVR